ncbi:Glyoxalase/Bleomycin resistance protein/Dihydroxybiphenyl dioxygenase [Xylariomycetidae sp. FL2044]|nr:Glyoxalase/Bleomycin resistance protein/Dihydroxybiphenyl dioxygenase [Xylariomycetidae sp. FL2044]
MANSNSDTVMPPASLAHVVLRTGQFVPMKEFYKAFLGARTAYENENMSFLSYDEEHHRIAIAAVPGTRPKVRDSSGLEHIAFTFNSLADLATAYKQRKARDILPVWCTNHGPTTSMYYQDPDGNMIETQVNNFDTAEAAQVYMLEAMVENPLGADFDPEDLVRRVESGEPEAQIKKRPNVGKRGLEDAPINDLPPPLVKNSYEPINLAA